MMRRRIPLFNTEAERDGLRQASRFNAELLDFLRPQVVAGTTTQEIDRLAYSYTLDHGHTPACLGYPGPVVPYPKSICTSINDVVCHGVPDDRPLESGDIINVDLTTIVDGWFGDQSETFLIGEVSDEARKVVQVAFDCLYLGIQAIGPGGHVDEIGRAIYDHARGQGMDVVREYQGHGIGRKFHQEPGIPHLPSRTPNRTAIPPGTCFTIEPMINTGTWHTVMDESDGWTVRTRDGGLSAQWEHTLLMTEEGVEILTRTENGPREGHRF
ncbi:MAG: type I methionyl aminopeptidase [Planctomycetaceae bacterium]|nr:type I methionyl aminopeptidase [Planctomycetaceae bacterium]